MVGSSGLGLRGGVAGGAGGAARATPPTIHRRFVLRQQSPDQRIPMSAGQRISMSLGQLSRWFHY